MSEAKFGEPWVSYDSDGMSIVNRYGRFPDDQPSVRRVVLCVNALAGLSQEQITTIDWGKVPALVEAAKRLCDVDITNFASRMVELHDALAAVERK